MTPLFKNFLTDPSEYARAEQFWEETWNRIVAPLGQRSEWNPWLVNRFADGTAMRDGNPIFNRASKRFRRCVRLIQEEFVGAAPELDFWLDRIPVYSKTAGGFKELVIRCELTDASAERVEELMEAWVTRGEITIRSNVTERSYEGAEMWESSEELQVA